ncbi:hypothetical protein A2U01_0110602, partial [Trifolium medium]|nr:hypothetical protein [Trifolium medium]
MMARCAPMLVSVGTSSVICAPRRIGWRIAPVRERKHWSFSPLRAAQERLARRASQLEVMHQ